MSVIKRNIIANFGGNIWTGLMGLVFVPLYIHFLGIEAYGLMGIFAMLLAVFGILDMGMSSTLNREMARLSVQKDKAKEMRDLVRTLEIPYWVVGLIISISISLMSPFIAYHWVNAENISSRTVQTAIVIMGLTFAFQWPMSFYSGGLMGLQRQVLLNIISVLMATFRGFGAILILWLVSPTVEAFFSWQLLVSIIHIGLIVIFLKRSLPYCIESPCFRRELFLKIWRFAAGMTGISVMTIILMQMDKVILSHMLSLEFFGYYSLANVISINLYRFIYPVFSATYPRLTNLVALGATQEIAILYHKSAQLVSVLVLPTALIISMFSKEILLLWTQDPVTTEQTHLLVSILVIGTALNGLMNIPYALQLASGWTRLTFFVNVVSVIILVPLMIVLTRLYGPVGAASVWVILNTGYILIGIPLMHRRLLPAEKWRWYFEDIGRPLLAALMVSIIGRLIISPNSSTIMLIISLCIVSGATLLASACASNQLDTVGRLKYYMHIIKSRLSPDHRY